MDGSSLRHWLLADTDEANAAVRKMVVLEKVFIFLISECSESMFVSWYVAVSNLSSRSRLCFDIVVVL